MDNSRKLFKAKMVLRGAICGDIIGSAYEWKLTKNYNFNLFTDRSSFTDDTVCSIAVAESLITNESLVDTMQKWCRRYPHAGYGGMFRQWIRLANPEPYGSYGNGSAMRVSAAGAIAQSVEECLALAEQSAIITHSHPEGIKGAQAVALAIRMALEDTPKEEIKSEIEERFGYDLSRRYADIKADYKFQVSCQKSVPEAIIAFLASDDYESTVRRAVALGGDADTQAAIAGGIAAAYYGEIPQFILTECMRKLPEEMKSVINKFDLMLENKHGK